MLQASPRLFPLLLVALLAAITFGLESLIGWLAISPPPNSPNTEAYRIEDFRASEFGIDGQLIQRLDGKAIWQFPQQNVVYFTAPHYRRFEQGKLVGELTAEQARYHTEQKTAEFNGATRLVRHVHAGRPEAILETQALEVDVEKRVARSKQQSVFRQAGSTVESAGFIYHDATGQVSLSSRPQSRVKIIHEPKPSP